MELVATLVIVLGAMAVVLWPLFGPRVARATAQPSGRDRVESLLSRRDSAYDAIRDLDFEYRLGNLSDGDYHDLRERYREQAAAVLQTLDRLEALAGPDAVGARHAGPGDRAGAVPSDGVRSAPTKPPAPRRAAWAYCPWCGDKVDGWAAQCRGCGGSLEETR